MESCPSRVLGAAIYCLFGVKERCGKQRESRLKTGSENRKSEGLYTREEESHDGCDHVLLKIIAHANGVVIHVSKAEL